MTVAFEQREGRGRLAVGLERGVGESELIDEGRPHDWPDGVWWLVLGDHRADRFEVGQPAPIDDGPWSDAIRANTATSPTARPMMNSSAMVQMSLSEWTRNVYSGSVWKKLNDKQAAAAVITPASRPPRAAAATITTTSTSAALVLPITSRTGTSSPPTAIAAAVPAEPVRKRTRDVVAHDDRPSTRARRLASGSFTTSQRRRTAIFTPSDRVGALLLRADADESIDVGDPDLAVADLAGRRGVDDDVDDALDIAVVDDDVDA